MAGFRHIPVLLGEVLAGIDPRPGGVYVDATLGGGGHAAELLRRSQPGGRLIGIDADPAAVAAAGARLATEFAPAAFVVLHGRFADLAALVRAQGHPQVDGILFDLGVSSHQFDTAERGFAFTSAGPLDMRMDPSRGPSAADLLAELSEQELADLIYRYGEERLSRRIARRICERRQQQPITTTGELAQIIAQAVGREYRRERIHPATRTFQALRIAVNQELAQLEQALPQAVDLLAAGGRLAVISFHSLEDRIVKQFLRAESGYGVAGGDPTARLRIITRKPLTPAATEQAANPRSRSARLRVAERVAL